MTDADALDGFQLEKITYDGLDTGATSVVSDQIDWPWTSPPTATSASQPWGGTLTAVLTGTAETDTYVPLASGGTRQTQTTSTYDNSTGLPLTSDDMGDVSPSPATPQARCTTYSYPAAPSAAGLIAYPDEVKTTACTTPGSPLVSDTRYSYDGQAFGAAPVSGNVTETQVYSSGDPGVTAHWVAQSRDTYDSYGRLLTSEDANGNTTSHEYSSAYGTGDPVTQARVASPLTVTASGTKYATTTANLNPAWGSPVSTLDAAGETAAYAYDPLGRVTSVWQPGEATSAPANYTYSYDISATAAPFVVTDELEDATGSGTYVTSYQIYDSLLRPHRGPRPGRGQRHRGHRHVLRLPGRHHHPERPVRGQRQAVRELRDTTEAQVPDETAASYNSAGRKTASRMYSDGKLQSQTTWQYPGADETVQIRPLGSGHRHLHRRAGPDHPDRPVQVGDRGRHGDYDATAYGYTPAGQLPRRRPRRQQMDLQP